jgi:integrase/recombinase XerD
VLLQSGLREQELMFLEWPDVDFKAHVVRVTHKLHRNWTPKAYKEREIPISDALVESLKAHKAKCDCSCALVFPTSGCRPRLDFLDHCKEIAQRAGLNPDDWWLHRFRATFCTSCLRSGIDLRTVQAYMGHSDLASTLRYLKPARSQEARAKVNNITWGD